MPVVRRAPVLAAFVLALAAAGCEGKEEPPAPPAARSSVGLFFHDSASGMMLDLPSSWRGRYRVAVGVTEPAEGLERELAFRFIRADSSSAADAPMLVARIFSRAAWAAFPSDSQRARFGIASGGDSSHAIVLTRAAGNPFKAGTADAAAYDSLMIALFQRPLRTALRQPGR